MPEKKKGRSSAPAETAPQENLPGLSTNSAATWPSVDPLISLTRAGFHLWPLLQSGVKDGVPQFKKPLTQEGSSHRVAGSADPDQVEAWWAAGHRHWGYDPAASRVAVFDIDDESGRAAWNGLVDEVESDQQAQLDQGVVLPTSRGEHHLYRLPVAPDGFESNEDLRLKTTGLGLEYIAHNNLRLHPSPEMLGWIEFGCPMVALPAPLKQKVRAASSGGSRSRSVASGEAFGGFVDLPNGWTLDGLLMDAPNWPVGERNDKAFAIAFALAKAFGSSSQSFTLGLVRQVCETSGLTDSAETIVRSAYKRAAGLGIAQVPDWRGGSAKTSTADPDASPFVDLADLIAKGLPEPLRPDVIQRSDGVGLTYAGQVNWLFGDSDAGKTWIALAGIAQTVQAGSPAWFIDTDHNTATAIVHRLHLLGLPLDMIGNPELFRYAEPQSGGHLREVLDEAMEKRPALVVLDSMGEVLGLLGLNQNKAEEFTEVHTHLLKPFAAEAGASLVVIDHVSRSADSRAQGATGTIAKKRVVGGTSLRAERVGAGLRPGQGGQVRITVHKDRHGGLRQHCPNGGTGEPQAAVFTLGAEGGWSLEPQKATPLGEVSERFHKDMAKLVAIVGANQGIAKTALRDALMESLEVSTNEARGLITSAVEGGFLVARRGKQRTDHHFTSEKEASEWFAKL